jgi:hypothetical protein
METPDQTDEDMSGGTLVILACTARRLGTTLGLCLITTGLHAQWTAPTPEELSMTEQKGAPGAPAVYLYREQVTDDGWRMFSFYVRLKVLTEGGKERANVELPYVEGNDHLTVDSIAGRTIHPDGSIIPFTGKPYDKLVVKGKDYKEMAKVFTLPAVEVGSILEYRYKLHYDDAYFLSPDWYIQSDTYMRKGHYTWHPTTREVENSRGVLLGHVAWTPVLPPGAEVKITQLHGGRHGNELNDGSQIELDVNDIPPLPTEQLMPPPSSLSYRVLFYYTSYATTDEFWKSEGKRWSKDQDKFIGPGKGVRAFVEQTVAAGDTPEQKLKKLYDVVMTFENTDFSRVRSNKEDKASGFKPAENTDDVLARKRGNGDQLTDLFVAMARAAGVKAYVMGVANRVNRIFMPTYMSMRQLDDDIAVVDLDGKELFFDPGQRYCEFKQLAWMHERSGGIRQTDSGVEVIATPMAAYKSDNTQRVADLNLDEHGEATGTVKMTYTGNPALYWRQRGLRGDEASVNQDLRTALEELLPGGMEIRVKSMQNLTNPDKPLVVDYEVKGPIGTPTGKRLLIVANLFQVNAKPLFPESKRDLAVYIHSMTYTQDAVRIKYPDGLQIESVPKDEQEVMANEVAFTSNVKQTGKSVTSFRNMTVAKYFFMQDEYPALKGFYGKLETRDQEPVVLVRSTTTAAATTPAGPGK